MKKNNKSLYIVIGVLAALVIALVVLVIVLTSKSGSQERVLQAGNEGAQLQDGGQTDITEEGKLAEVFGEEIANEDFPVYSATMKLVVGGYEFTIPKEYDMFYTEGVGAVVYMPDIFQMKLKVVEDSYETMMEDAASITKKSLEAGGTILQDVKEMVIDGIAYAFYRVELSGDECFLVYTQAPEKEKRIAAQIVLKKSDLSDEDVLRMFASVAGSAAETEQPDSDSAAIEAQVDAKTKSEIHGEMATEGTLEVGNHKITHQVPDGFYAEEGYAEEDYAVSYYYTVEPRIDVTCMYFVGEDYNGLEQYLEISKYLSETEIKTVTIDGKQVSYFEESFMHGDSKAQQIYAGIEFDNGEFYVIDVDVIDEDIHLTMDMVRDFLFLSR